MVASRHIQIPFCRGIGRQRGWGFGELAQIIGKSAIPLLHKFSVPAAKSVGADLLEFAAPDIAEVFTGRRNFKTAAKSVGRQTLKKQLGSGSMEGLQTESFQRNQNKSAGRGETFLQTFPINHVK